MELPLQQHPSFAAALALLGTRVSRVTIKGAGTTQMITRFGIAFASRGPIWHDEDPAALRGSPLWMINAERPSDIYQKAGFRQLMTPAHVAELNLRQTDWMAQANGKWRNAWRSSDKSGLDCAPFDPIAHKWLLIADQRQQRRKGYRALPHSIVTAYASISPDDVVVFTATQDNENIAAMLFLRHGQVATYQIGWSGAAGRKTNAHYALLKKAADYFTPKGVTRFDLGLVDTENSPSLARFKIGTGATVRPLGGTWLRIPGL